MINKKGCQVKELFYSRGFISNIPREIGDTMGYQLSSKAHYSKSILFMSLVDRENFSDPDLPFFSRIS